MDRATMNHRILNDFDNLWNDFQDSDDSTKATLCRQYALLKFDLYNERSNQRDLDEAIEKARWATIASDESWSMNLGSFLWKRYECNNNSNDADEAITLTRRATTLMAIDDPTCIGGLNNLRQFLNTRFERFGNIEDLEEAIQVSKRSLQVPDIRRDPHFAEKLRLFAQDLDNFGELLRSRHQRLGQVCDLDDAIEVARDVVSFTSIADPDRPAYLNNLALALNCKYDVSKDVMLLEEAVQLGRDAVRLTQRDDQNLTVWLGNLGMFLGNLYERTGQMDTLEESIKVLHRGIEALPPGHVDLAAISNNLGTALHGRYDKLKKREDLDEAVRMGRQAVRLTPIHSPKYISILPNLGDLLSKQYAQNQDMTTLLESVQIGRKVVDLTPRNHPKFAQRMNNLAARLGQKYSHDEDVVDLHEIVKLSREAHMSVPRESLDFPHSLNTLAAWLSQFYERTGNIEYLNEAKTLGQEALALASKDSPEYAGMLHNQGCNLRFDYEITGDESSLDEATNLETQALGLLQDGHSQRPIVMNSLALCTADKYQITGDMSLLNKSIEILRKIVELKTKEKPNFVQYVSFMSNLANKLSWRYGNTGEIRDLEEAIRTGRRVVNLGSSDQPSYGGYLINLSNYLRHRYEYSGDVQYIEEAIQLARRAIQSTDANHPKISTAYDNLSTQLYRQYEMNGVMEVLEEAIEARRESIRLDTSESSLPDHLQSLASLLDHRYQRIRNFNDIEEAIESLRKAVSFRPDGHHVLALAGHLGTLADIIGHRYELKGNKDDLTEALELAHKTVNIIPNGHPKMMWALNTLGIQLSRGYDFTHKDDYLVEALQVAQRSIDITSETNPDMAAHYFNLASNFSRRYERLKEDTDLEQAIKAALRSWECSQSPPFVRLKSCNLALHLFRLSMRYEDAFILSRKALDVIPLLHRRSLNVADQQHVARHFAGFATEACSLALETGKSPALALEELERGRGVILRLLMEDRRDMALLEAKQPELFARYEALRLQIGNTAQDTPIEKTTGKSNEKSSNHVAEKRSRAAIELEQCIAEIQELPEFQTLFKGLKTAQMKACATQGNIIVVNITKIRSDALIVTTDGIESIPLPDLGPRDAFDWVKKDLTAPSLQDRGKTNKEYRDFLAWLWRGCVKPILNHIGYLVQASTVDLPRVWWIGSGLASSFPFHAANSGSPSPMDNSRYRVISSYTTTIKALQSSRERASMSEQPPSMKPRLLAIAMPETPGATSLPGTRAELSAVKTSLGNTAAVEVLEGPDVSSSLARLKYHNIAHFACHGISDYTDPSRSGLILYGPKSSSSSSSSSSSPTMSGSKPTSEVLTVQRILQAHFSTPRIAYLSACSTAQNSVDTLKDEVLHAVSGFQVAGFQHVLGCMWPSDDSICVKVAETFYASLARTRDSWRDDRAVALAMHDAVLRIQEDEAYRKRPLLWAQYVHFGA